MAAVAALPPSGFAKSVPGCLQSVKTDGRRNSPLGTCSSFSFLASGSSNQAAETQGQYRRNSIHGLEEASKSDLSIPWLRTACPDLSGHLGKWRKPINPIAVLNVNNLSGLTLKTKQKVGMQWLPCFLVHNIEKPANII